MALVLADRVKETTTTTGTSDFALGGAVSGFQTFSAGVGNSNTTYYSVALGSDWEVGLGTLSANGLTLARTTVLQSSNSDAKVVFASGSKDVFVTYPADKAVLSDSTQTLTNKTLTSPTLTTPILGTPQSGVLTNATGLPLTTGVTGTLPVANGGTGTTTPSIIAGTNVTVTGTWPNQTIAASGGGASAATPTALGTVYGITPAGTAAVALGYQAATTTTSATGVTAIGYQAGQNNTSNNVTAIGYQAGQSNTGTANTFIGLQSGTTNTSGNQNSSFGQGSFGANTTGSNNIAIGRDSLQANTTASNGTAVGFQAGYSNTTGNSNSSLGYQSLYSCTTGYENSILGKAAGYNITTGGSNICIGTDSGQGINTGNRNIHIGYLTNASGSGVSDELLLSTWYSTTGKGSNTGFINTNGGNIYQGNNSTLWAITSDQRLKKNIVDNNIGLEKLTQIQVRNFEYRLPTEVTELPQAQAIQKSGVQLGVIAQELQTVLPECVKTESTGVMSVDADNLTWYMINAIKELKAEFDAYKATHP